MKKIYYQVVEKVLPQVYLLYKLLNNVRYEKYKKENILELEQSDPVLYKSLVDNQYIVPDDFDEREIVLFRKKRMQFDTSMYQVMVNTTLDCNLNCWYCYENRITGSFLKSEVIEAIKKNIEQEYIKTSYRILKLSFFGGEPFLYFRGIKEILDFARNFCQVNQLDLIAEFTTNAILITESIIDYLKNFECQFQITLDGDRIHHNQIKKDKDNPNQDTYEKTLRTIRLINDKIPNRWLAVRINFDNKTLEKIDEIIGDLDFLDRKYCFVILKKVWQLEKDKVNVPLLHASVQKFLDKKFLLDYYIMPKGEVCFAERHREVLFNYDGKVFKCSTISSFDDKNALGEFDLQSGQVHWNETKLSYWLKEMLPQNCIDCKLLPACLGPCNKQIMLHPGENICTFDAINMTLKEYLMYLFKCQLLKEELYA